MNFFKQNKQILTIKLDISNLNPQQIRLIKNINSLLVFLSEAEEEAEFFEASSDLVKRVANLIQQSSFAESQKSQPAQINYADQAIEFSVDTLLEELKTQKLSYYDH